jgi:8-oxo-dGTP diphosphatase
VTGGQPLRAGGLVWRRSGREPELLVVHRPKHHDWSLPKGKVDDGEDLVTAAVREVFEETGFQCAIEEYAGSIVYEPASDPKPTHYWWMAVVSGAFHPNAEVDAVRWCPFAALGSCLTADLDRQALTRWKLRRQRPS